MKEHPSPEFLNAVSELMNATKRYLDELDLIPREGRTDSILLGLLSKSIVLMQAITLLVSNTFDDEAFGLCRSCVELQLIVRYMTNRDTAERSRRYFYYFAKDKRHWFDLIDKYYPNMETKMRVDIAELDTIAAEYPSPHRWSEHELKYFASEGSAFEMREDGTPVNDLFYYEVLYKWMSHYVHATHPCLEPFHITAPGDRFRVHPGQGSSKRGADALRVSFLSVHMNLIRILRYLNMTYPEHLESKYDAVVELYVKGRASSHNSSEPSGSIRGY